MSKKQRGEITDNGMFQGFVDYDINDGPGLIWTNGMERYFTRGMRKPFSTIIQIDETGEVKVGDLENKWRTL